MCINGSGTSDTNFRLFDNRNVYVSKLFVVARSVFNTKQYVHNNIYIRGVFCDVWRIYYPLKCVNVY